MADDPAFLETLFRIGNLTAMAGWIILIFLPRRWPLLFLVPSLLIPLLLGVAYAALILPAMAGTGGDFSSLEGVKTLLSSDRALLAGWFHYLAFDMLVGTMIAKAEDEAGISRIIQAPILVLTFMLGPIGFVLHVITLHGWRAVRADRP